MYTILLFMLKWWMLRDPYKCHTPLTQHCATCYCYKGWAVFDSQLCLFSIQCQHWKKSEISCTLSHKEMRHSGECCTDFSESTNKVYQVWAPTLQILLEQEVRETLPPLKTPKPSPVVHWTHCCSQRMFEFERGWWGGRNGWVGHDYNTRSAEPLSCCVSAGCFQCLAGAFPLPQSPCTSKKLWPIGKQTKRQVNREPPSIHRLLHTCKTGLMLEELSNTTVTSSPSRNACLNISTLPSTSPEVVSVKLAVSQWGEKLVMEQ